MTATVPGQRLDKWLWGARFFKTRTLAGKQCEGGHIKVDGSTMSKAHFAVRPGMVLTFVQGRHIRVIKVLALAVRRGPAPEAQALYEDLDPPTAENALPPPPGSRTPLGMRAGPRPTKRDRRVLSTLRRDDPSA